MANDYYETLGVPSDASPQDIKRAFRQIARECHPDVAGGDPAAEERFKGARTAYETLMDPVTRARYDRRQKRKDHGGGSFFEAFYRNTEGPARTESRREYAAHNSGGHHTGGKKAQADPNNKVSMDSILDDFGNFGFGVVGMRPKGAESTGGQSSWEAPPPSTEPQQGDDVHIELDIPEKVARDGGMVTAVYFRLQRSQSWRPGSDDPGLVRIQDLFEVRVTPGTRHGELFRVPGMGSAGAFGGAFGDLVVRAKLIGAQEAKRSARRGAAPPSDRPSWSGGEPGPSATPPPRSPNRIRFSSDEVHRSRQRPEPVSPSRPETEPAPPPPPVPEPHPAPEPRSEPQREPAPAPAPEPQREPAPEPRQEPRVQADPQEAQRLDITVVEALLGGRVEVQTPTGTVRLTIPGGTSGGTRLRLRSRGELDANGVPGDLYVQIRIVVPKLLDDESRELIEAFARLNPMDPREG
ncbi:MAG: J domain-containing protein [Deltaproteobacteria bacterium]|nr:J domain-containing protein [Deltaproteobacteria bacterium]